MKPAKITQISKIANEVLTDMFAKNTPVAIRKKMEDVLDKQLDTIILSAIGLERDSWRGSIKVAYEGSFSNFYKRISGAQAHQIASEVLAKILEEANVQSIYDLLSKEDKRQILMEMKRGYRELLREETIALLREAARINAKQLVNAYLESLDEKPAMEAEDVKS